ncbi:uncharacterized protein [Chelonus insularis]|uniref:uncharacterized protein n=1 Tax=Chelonus insularis TaxID=460826 RepID=UPI00158BDEF7|nr:uncharacterized protein LOC118064425 [Chelonus insularis]
MYCSICNEFSSPCSLQVLRHMQLFHSHNTVYPCINNCNRTFASIPTLKKHIKICLVAANDLVTQNNTLLKSEVKFDSTLNNTDHNDHTESSEDQSSIGTIVDDKCIERKFLQFIGYLYNKPSLSRLIVQDIVENFSELTHGIISIFKHNLKTAIPSDYHDLITNILQINPCSNFDSEYKRFKYFKGQNLLITPVPFKIGEIKDDKKMKGTVVLTNKQCFAQVVPMRIVLRQFFELPNVYERIISYIKDESSRNYLPKLYTSLFQGKIWENISNSYGKKVVIPLYLYYDDFEISNTLSSAAGIYKIGAFYFSIASMPPEYSSSIDSVFLAEFIHTMDLKEFGNEKCCRAIVDELKFLAEEGIWVDVNGINKQIFFVLIGVLGDNLGMNGILGFSESFIAEYFCRCCRSTNNECSKQLVENKGSLRNIHNYEDDTRSLSTGVKEKCIFNVIPHYHCTINITWDLMHDLYLGICRYDMAKIIDHCIKKNYFSLEHLNNRLKYFDYSEIDRGKKISFISAHHIHKGNIIITASEMSALISYFGIIVVDLVPVDDDAWELYNTLYEIIDIVTSSSISEYQVIHLEQLIRNHNELFINLFGPLVPKSHFLTHYPSCIKNMGPIKNLSGSKFESFHQLSKKNAHVVNSRINITYTLALKMQLQVCYRILSQKGLEPKIEYGQVLEISDNYESTFSSHIGAEACTVSWVKINGTIYKPDFGIYVKNDDFNDPMFGIIISIIMSKDCTIFLVYKECYTIGFNNHQKGYEIVTPNIHVKTKLFNINNNFYVRPVKIHVTANGKKIISRRDLQ